MRVELGQLEREAQRVVERGARRLRGKREGALGPEQRQAVHPRPHAAREQAGIAPGLPARVLRRAHVAHQLLEGLLSVFGVYRGKDAPWPEPPPPDPSIPMVPGTAPVAISRLTRKARTETVDSREPAAIGEVSDVG